MLETHEDMTCEEKLGFWKDVAEFWKKEAMRREAEVEELMDD